jgi:hypothetical protein
MNSEKWNIADAIAVSWNIPCERFPFARLVRAQLAKLCPSGSMSAEEFIAHRMSRLEDMWSRMRVLYLVRNMTGWYSVEELRSRDIFIAAVVVVEALENDLRSYRWEDEVRRRRFSVVYELFVRLFVAIALTPAGEHNALSATRLLYVAIVLMAASSTGNDDLRGRYFSEEYSEIASRYGLLRVGGKIEWEQSIRKVDAT